MTDLWPDDLNSSPVTTPLTIMREQAALLGGKTSNIVKAEVIADDSDRRFPKETETVDLIGGIASYPFGRPFAEKYDFVYRFYIVAPTLRNYRYRLFTAGYTTRLYPVVLLLDADIASEIRRNKDVVDNDRVSADSEDTFVRLLKMVLRSRQTRRIIEILRSQALEESLEDDAE